jgi:PTS system nitrogen regulatory IIA component
MKLAAHIDPKLSYLIPRVAGRDELLAELAKRIAAARGVDEAKLLAALLAREKQCATAMPGGVALPHAMLEGLDRSFVALAKVNGGLDFGGPHGKGVDLFLVLVGPTGTPWEHVRLLARVARICNVPGALEKLRTAKSGERLHQLMLEEDMRHA